MKETAGQYLDKLEDGYDELQIARAKIIHLKADLAEARRENERLQQRHHQHTYCAYCGMEFPADTEGAVDEVGKHIWECEKHPLAKTRWENVRLREERDDARRENDGWIRAMKLIAEGNDRGAAIAHSALQNVQSAEEQNDAHLSY